MPIRIAALFNAFEPVFLSATDRRELFVVVLANTPLMKYVKETYNSARIIVVEWVGRVRPPLDGISFYDAIKNTDLTEKLRAYKITHFVVPHESEAMMDRWSKNTGVKLILVDGKIQRSLENKINFDNLLKKNKIPSPPTFQLADLLKRNFRHIPMVVQEAVSHGMYGTKFYCSGAEAYQAIRFKKQNKLLIRAYEEGVPVGVSVFLDNDGNMFFSSLRRQCFVYQNGFPAQYLGIQWLPGDFFPSSQMTAVAVALVKLARTLKDLGFVGIANFDLLIKKTCVSIIECNPRLSAATPQVFSVPGLVPIRQSWKFYCRSFTDFPNRSIFSTKFPSGKFFGSELDVDILTRSIFKKDVPKIGQYRLDQDKITYVGKKYRLRGRGKEFFAMHDLNPQGKIEYPVTIESVFSNFPLFDLDCGSLNQDGERIVAYFRNLCLK